MGVEIGLGTNIRAATVVCQANSTRHYAVFERIAINQSIGETSEQRELQGASPTQHLRIQIKIARGFLQKVMSIKNNELLHCL